MTDTIAAFVFMAFVAAICLVVTSIGYTRKRKAKNRLLQQFHRLGANYSIAFSSKEVLHRTIVGLDGLQRKLLILKKRTGATAISKLVDLFEMQSCVMKKHYSVIGASGKTRGKPEQRLERITLHILMDDGSGEEITFYDHLVNPVMDVTRLANKARHWEIMLTKLQVPMKKIA